MSEIEVALRKGKADLEQALRDERSGRAQAESILAKKQRELQRELTRERIARKQAEALMFQVKRIATDFHPMRPERNRPTPLVIGNENTKSLEQRVAALEDSLSTMHALINSLVFQDPMYPKPLPPEDDDEKQPKRACGSPGLDDEMIILESDVTVVKPEDMPPSTAAGAAILE